MAVQGPQVYWIHKPSYTRQEAPAGSWIEGYTKPHQPCRQSHTGQSYRVCKPSLTKKTDLAILAQQIQPYWTYRTGPYCAKQEDLEFTGEADPAILGRHICTPTPIRQANPKVLENRPGHAMQLDIAV